MSGAVSSKGTKLGVSDTLPAVTYINVQCTIGIDYQNGENEQLDVTCLEEDVMKRYISGLADADTLELSFNVNFDDPGYQILVAAKASGNVIGFQIEMKAQKGFTTGRIMTFEGVVKTLPFNFAVGSPVTGSGSITLTEAITQTPPVATTP